MVVADRLGDTAVEVRGAVVGDVEGDLDDPDDVDGGLDAPGELGSAVPSPTGLPGSTGGTRGTVTAAPPGGGVGTTTVVPTA